MLQRYRNLKFLSHLNFFDLSNKFNFNNYYIIPKINKISMKLFIKGSLNSNFLNLYLKNYLLLFLYCFDILNLNLKFKKSKRQKLKSYKITLFLGYSVVKNNTLKVIYDYIFFLKKFPRVMFFSKHNILLSKSSGKLFSISSKIITLIPSLVLLDHKECRNFPFFKNSKIFLIFSLKKILTLFSYNFFSSLEKINKNFLKNFLLIWYLI